MALDFTITKKILSDLEKTPRVEIFFGHKDDIIVSHSQYLKDEGFILIEISSQLNNQKTVMGNGGLTPRGKKLLKLLSDDPSHWQKLMKTL